MKNVTDSLKPSESTAIAPVQPKYFEQDEFEISYNDFYTNPWNRHNGKAHLEALEELMDEGRRRGYHVSDSVSSETRVHYVKFWKPYDLRGKSTPDLASKPALPGGASIPLTY